MYAIYGNIYHQYTPNVSIYTIHGSYGDLNSREPLSEVPSDPKSAGRYSSNYLLGGIPTPLKNYESPVGMMTFPIYGKIEFMFQTTNQISH